MSVARSTDSQTGQFKAMLDNFPSDSMLGDDFLMSDDEEYAGEGGDKTPTGRGRSGGNRGDPTTPPLSLPDSFDQDEEFEKQIGYRSGDNNNRGGGGDRKLRSELSRLNALMQERNSNYRDLSISENLYSELRLKSEVDLSTYELAQLKTHEYTMQAKRDLEKIRRTLQTTQSEFINAQVRFRSSSFLFSFLVYRFLQYYILYAALSPSLRFQCILR